MSRLIRPIFIVGCPRSGTTLVQCILSASSLAFSLPETHFFSHILPAFGAQPATRLNLDDLRRLRTEIEYEADLPPVPDVWTVLEAGSPPTALEVFIALVERFRPENDATRSLRAIEKTPRHVLQLPTIAACFPDVRFVNVVRDPIDVASSLLNVPFASSRSVLSHAQRWTESVLTARAFTEVHPEQIHTLVYEELVRQPEATTRDLCAFVELPYEAAMLEEFGREAPRNVGRAETWKRDVGRGVLLNRQGVWRERMSPGQAWLVAQATRGLRHEFGFTETPSAAAGSILAAVVSEFGVRFREARTSTGVVGAARYAGSVLKTLAPA